jgi:hypothetical protein
VRSPDPPARPVPRAVAAQTGTNAAPWGWTRIGWCDRLVEELGLVGASSGSEKGVVHRWLPCIRPRWARLCGDSGRLFG